MATLRVNDSLQSGVLRLGQFKNRNFVISVFPEGKEIFICTLRLHFVSQISIPAKEVAQRTDLHCVVDGPVERELCVKLFTDPRVQKAFAAWKKH